MSIIIRPRVVPITLTLPVVRTGVAGGITVTKRGRDGKPLPVRIDRSKRTFQRVWEHHQSNLITNGGLDAIGSETSFTQMLTAIGVGTSSTAPAVTDTGLGVELARTSSQLGLVTAAAYSQPSTGLYRYVRGVAFNFGEANGNLTEFGGFTLLSGGVCCTRELFRDEFSSPVVVTKTSSEQVVISYTLEVTQSPTTPTATTGITITGIGAFDMSLMFYQGYNFSITTGYIRNFGRLRVLPAITVGSTYSDNRGGSDEDDSREGINQVNISSPGSAQGMAAYVGGSYKRTMQTVIPAGINNATYDGFLLHNYSAEGTSAWHTLCGFDFTSPVSLVHDKDYRLTLNADFSWARA